MTAGQTAHSCGWLSSSVGPGDESPFLITTMSDTTPTANAISVERAIVGVLMCKS